MVRVASIDLGSNSTRLLIADITNGTITTIYKEHQVTRMADKLSETKIISKESSKRVLKVLASFFKTINKNNVENIQIVGTAALRDSTNREEITQLIEKRFGFEVIIVSGWGIIPNTFFSLLKIPAIFFKDPLGLNDSSIVP